nr:putative ribonuclease H-like domain-containing protein [Tanacetum cinerariifolium]
HFIRDCFEKKLISVDHIHTDENVADPLTKPFDAGRFQYLVFWSTARIETTEERTKILATVDGKLRTIFESSIRRNLKLNDEAGISSLPDADLFENLQLMGYNILPNQKFTFQKGQYSHQWKYLIHTIMQCLGPKSTRFNEFSSNIATALGEGSGTPTESHHTSTSEASQSSQHELPSPSLLPVTTESLLTLSDSTPRVTSLATDEGSMQHKLDELTDLCTSLQRQQSKMISKFALQELEINRLKAKIKLLEDKDRGVTEQSGDDALIKGRGVQVVLTAAEVATATISIPTGSGVVSTANPTFPTAAPIFTTATESTPYMRRKGKETIFESETPKKKKIARDAKITRIHAEEELQIMIDGLDRNNETVAKYLQEYHQFATELPIGRRIELISDLVKYQANYAKVLKYQTQQRKPLTRKQQREFYTSVLRN